MIGQGVSSRSSHSAAAGRTVFSAKPWTQSRRSFWSESSSRENVVMAASEAAGSVVDTVTFRLERAGGVPRAKSQAQHTEHRYDGAEVAGQRPARQRVAEARRQERHRHGGGGRVQGEGEDPE